MENANYFSCANVTTQKSNIYQINVCSEIKQEKKTVTIYGTRAVATTLIGGGCIFIYSGSAQLVSFEIKLISKEVSRA